jgi:hypothetical protein
MDAAVALLAEFVIAEILLGAGMSHVAPFPSLLSQSTKEVTGQIRTKRAGNRPPLEGAAPTPIIRAHKFQGGASV